MKHLLISNWKMKPATAGEAREIVQRADEFLQGLADRVELSLIICPPYVFLDEVKEMLGQSHMLHDAELGAQDISTDDGGALTGEVSGAQLEQSGVRYVIVGHSERRWKLGEDDAIVNQKLKAVLRNRLIPIVCVGERQRDDGWRDELRAQVSATFEGVSADDIRRCLIAYEPVWAISTNLDAKPDTPDSARESVLLIREALGNDDDIRFLYGGSVSAENIESFVPVSEVGGFLVGGASVRPDEYVALLRVMASLAT